MRPLGSGTEEKLATEPALTELPTTEKGRSEPDRKCEEYAQMLSYGYIERFSQQWRAFKGAQFA
jgi:hypothetical protein